MEKGWASTNLVICSDIQAAVKAIMVLRITSKLVQECQMLLRQLAIHGRAKLLWVVGIRRYEIADELARKRKSARRRHLWLWANHQGHLTEYQDKDR